MRNGLAPTFYEFFCGGGGARAGLGDGWQCLVGNDIDPVKMRSYTDNWGGRGAITRDVAALTPADLPGAASLAWASFPCQDLSEAGAGAGLNGDRSNALWPCLELIDALRANGRPLPMIVLENVVGLMSPRSEGFLDAICNKLTGMGYRFGALEIDAALFVPQSRERVFIVAVAGGPRWPASLWPRPSSHSTRRRSSPPCVARRPRRSTAFADLIEDNPTGVPWHDKVETERLIAMMAPTHAAKVEDAKRASIANGRKMVGGLYRRMRPAAGGEDGAGQRVQRAEVRFDDVAGCLRVPSGGSVSLQTIPLVDGVNGAPVAVVLFEAAGLMALPDDDKPARATTTSLAAPWATALRPRLFVRHLAAHVLEPVLRANGALSLAAE